MEHALVTLKGRSPRSAAPWGNRRGQEYEAKITRANRCSIAEVVAGDLHRNAGTPDQSYSDGQILMKPPAIAWRANLPPSSAIDRQNCATHKLKQRPGIKVAALGLPDGILKRAGSFGPPFFCLSRPECSEGTFAGFSNGVTYSPGCQPRILRCA